MQPMEFVQKYKWYLLLVILLILSIVTFQLFFSQRINSDSLIVGEHSSHLVDHSNQPNTTCNIFVDVSGAVNKPNVYCFKTGELVIDALKRAGGYLKNKEAREYIRSNINLARPLVANEKVYFPYRYELQYIKMQYDLVPIQDESQISKDGVVKCISINSATLEQLDSLTGVGPSTAQKIIDSRPFKNIESLKDVSGIGDQLYAKVFKDLCL